MRVLLRITGLLSLAWAVLLLGLKQVVAGAPVPPLVRAGADAWGIANLVLAYAFWRAARDPARHHGVVYGAILLCAVRLGSDLYGLLILLPPERAPMILADLVLSVGLLVGLLEALPRLLAPQG